MLSREPSHFGLHRASFLIAPTKGTTMEIQFRHDVDRVLEEAKEQKKPVILDFSAAPM